MNPRKFCNSHVMIIPMHTPLTAAAGSYWPSPQHYDTPHQNGDTPACCQPLTPPVDDVTRISTSSGFEHPTDTSPWTTQSH